jgi:cytochrome c-type biogenesis protein CcmH/NrfG
MTHVAWPENEVWRRLEETIGVAMPQELAGITFDDEVALQTAGALAQARIDADPQDFRAYRTLAITCALRGSAEEAVTAMRVSLQLDPSAAPPAA